MAGPPRDLFPIVVHTLLQRTRSLLLLRRANTGLGDGLYQPPGGHLQAGESVSAAAIRECREEAGIHIDEGALTPLCVLPYRSPRGQGVNFVFGCELFSGDGVIGEPDRCDGAGWFPLDALPANTVPFLAMALACRERAKWFLEVGFR